MADSFTPGTSAAACSSRAHGAGPDDRARYFRDNRANWDDRAALHEASGYGIDELLASPEAITPEIAPDRGRLGDLGGLDVIHLQCHLGLDTVSLKRMGARRVVGLDMSRESLRRARSIAGRAGVRVELVESNVYDARQEVTGDFDVVYTSLGVLCWLPDVAAWARVVASLLRPGGRLVLRDDHPVFMAVGDDTSHGLTLHEPYFQRTDPMSWDKEGSYVSVSTTDTAGDTASDTAGGSGGGTVSGAASLTVGGTVFEPASDSAADEADTPAGTAADGATSSAPVMTHTVSHQWNHGVGEILTALLEAGLILDEVTETRFSAWCRWPDLMERCDQGWQLRDPALRDLLPLQLAVTAHLPGQV